LSLSNHRKYVTDVTLQIVMSAEDCILSNECEKHTSVYLYDNVI
jgi:hypothetical protein